MLIISWKMEAEEMCVYSRGEWQRGMSKLGVSSTRQLRSKASRQQQFLQRRGARPLLTRLLWLPACFSTSIGDLTEYAWHLVSPLPCSLLFVVRSRYLNLSHLSPSPSPSPSLCWSGHITDQLDGLRGEITDRRSPTFREFYMFCFEYAK